MRLIPSETRLYPRSIDIFRRRRRRRHRRRQPEVGLKTSISQEWCAGCEFLSDAHFLDLVTERKSMIHNTMRGGAGHGESMCGAKVTFQARIWRELYD